MRSIIALPYIDRSNTSVGACYNCMTSKINARLVHRIKIQNIIQRSFLDRHFNRAEDLLILYLFPTNVDIWTTLNRTITSRICIRQFSIHQIPFKCPNSLSTSISVQFRLFASHDNGRQIRILCIMIIQMRIA